MLGGDGLASAQPCECLLSSVRSEAVAACAALPAGIAFGVAGLVFGMRRIFRRWRYDAARVLGGHLMLQHSVPPSAALLGPEIFPTPIARHRARCHGGH
jgi:hypothetical protein